MEYVLKLCVLKENCFGCVILWHGLLIKINKNKGNAQFVWVNRINHRNGTPW